jgi:DNA polymerase III epsilon subunit-like protein
LETPIVAHAYKNERDFLDHEFARAKVIEWAESAYADERYICTQVLFAQLFPGASKSLTSMSDRLVLDSSERDDRHSDEVAATLNSGDDLIAAKELFSFRSRSPTHDSRTPQQRVRAAPAQPRNCRTDLAARSSNRLRQREPDLKRQATAQERRRQTARHALLPLTVPFGRPRIIYESSAGWNGSLPARTIVFEFVRYIANFCRNPGGINSVIPSPKG